MRIWNSNSKISYIFHTIKINVFRSKTCTSPNIQKTWVVHLYANFKKHCLSVLFFCSLSFVPTGILTPIAMSLILSLQVQQPQKNSSKYFVNPSLANYKMKKCICIIFTELQFQNFYFCAELCLVQNVPPPQNIYPVFIC